MKRLWVVLLSLLLLLCGCRAVAEDAVDPADSRTAAPSVQEQDQKPAAEQPVEEVPEEPSGQEATLRQEPCALTVTCGERSIAAMGGTYSWWFDNGDGTSNGIEACGVHPLDGQEYLPELITSEMEAQLQFDGEKPDSVVVHCWSTGDWGDTMAESEAVPMDGLTVQLKDTACVYEVAATWERFDRWGGTAYYAFYTSPEP